MTNEEKMESDMEALREAIDQTNRDIRHLHLSGKALLEAMKHIDRCMSEIEELKRLTHAAISMAEEP